MKQPNRITLNNWQILADDDQATAISPDNLEDITVKGRDRQDNIRLIMGKVWRCIVQEKKDDNSI